MGLGIIFSSFLYAIKFFSINGAPLASFSTLFICTFMFISLTPGYIERFTIVCRKTETRVARENEC